MVYSVAKNHVLLEGDLFLKGQIDSEVECFLRKIWSVCKKLCKHLPCLLLPTELIFQMQWEIKWTTDSYLNFTSFRVLHFFYWWDDMRHFISAESWCSLSWRNLSFSHWSRGMVRRYWDELCISVDPFVIYMNKPKAYRDHVSISEIFDSSFRNQKASEASVVRWIALLSGDMQRFIPLRVLQHILLGQ